MVCMKAETRSQCGQNADNTTQIKCVNTSGVVGLMIIQIAYPDTDRILVTRVCGLHVYWPDENKKHMQVDHTEILSKYRKVSNYL